MEPPTLYAPKPTSMPSDLQNALLAWDRNYTNKSYAVHSNIQTHDAVASHSAESLLQDAYPPEAQARLEEYTSWKLMTQIQVLQPKLTYFRMVLSCANLNPEQRRALQQFAADLRTTMDLVEAKNEDGSAASSHPHSPSEEDITNMSITPFASPTDGSSWEGSLSLPSDYSAKGALYSGGVAQLAGHNPSAFTPSASIASQEASQQSMAVPTFDAEAMYSLNEYSMQQAGSSYSYAPPQQQVPSTAGDVNERAVAGFVQPQDAILYPTHAGWTNASHGGPSSTMVTYPSSQASTWDNDLHIPGSFDGCNDALVNAVFSSVCDDRSPVSASSEGGIRRLRFNPAAILRGSRSPCSWSSNMSECSVIV
ncbi:hypothetical protein DAEQUDRAFT_731559 [Daedalea quercina L-15889]|uniref:Uncharacterized protein n=1 Tax=Daedalea quercina L-15889 TaxID=1314783 RepID=A0A165M6T8_9APHY|nr:hypothetical protein DAEQUDRAFT_731559 [Daedalea quercina L-15889]